MTPRPRKTLAALRCERGFRTMAADVVTTHRGLWRLVSGTGQGAVFELTND